VKIGVVAYVGCIKSTIHKYQPKGKPKIYRDWLVRKETPYRRDGHLLRIKTTNI
jgi:hypothetical protein